MAKLTVTIPASKKELFDLVDVIEIEINGTIVNSKGLQYDDYGRQYLEYEPIEIENASGYNSQRYDITIRAIKGYKFLSDIIIMSDGDRVLLSGDDFVKSKKDVMGSVGSKNFKVEFNRLELEFHGLTNTENYPYNKIYEVSSDSLNELKKFNYVVTRTENEYGGVIEEVKNYGKYITSLHVFPYTITSDKEEPILLGEMDTKVKANTISELVHDVDLGAIYLDKSVIKGVGYKNVKVIAYIPNFNPIDLNAEDVLGETLHMFIKLNLVSGKGTLNIISSRTDKVFYTETKQIGTKIPYSISENLTLNITSDVVETDYKIPYIDVQVLEPDNNARLDIVKHIDLGSGMRYIKDSEIYLDTKATEREQRLIKDFISKGVFIKEGYNGFY